MTKNWNIEAANIIKAAKARKGLSWEDVAVLLYERIGEDIHPRTLGNRVNKGAFTFALALQILAVLEFDKIDIPALGKSI
jgi:hypothetical protein